MFCFSFVLFCFVYERIRNDMEEDEGYIYIHRGEVQRLTSLHDTFDRFGPAKKKKEEEKEKKKK